MPKISTEMATQTGNNGWLAGPLGSLPMLPAPRILLGTSLGGQGLTLKVLLPPSDAVAAPRAAWGREGSGDTRRDLSLSLRRHSEDTGFGTFLEFFPLYLILGSHRHASSVGKHGGQVGSQTLLGGGGSKREAGPQYTWPWPHRAQRRCPLCPLPAGSTRRAPPCK